MSEFSVYNGAYSGPQVDAALARASAGGAIDAEIATFRAAVGTPLKAATAAAMTDHNKIYVYTGSEVGYTAGHWYYWDGAAWADGGVYNSTAFITDKTLAISGDAADSKVVGDYISALRSAICVPTITWNLGKLISSSGAVSNSNYYALTPKIPCSGGDTFINDTPSTDANNTYFVMYICTYKTTTTLNDTFVERKGFMANRRVTVDDDITGVRFCFGRASSSGVQITSTDISTYVSIEYYTKGASLEDYLYLKNCDTNMQNNIDLLNNNDDPDMFCYTSFDHIERFWTATGNLGSNTSIYHTQKCRIIPGGKLYLSGMANQEVIGAFFDAKGDWIAPFNKSDGSLYLYKKPDGTGTYSDYASIYEFTAPVAARYVSLNLGTNANVTYCTYVSSKPVFLLTDTGNYCVKDSPTYAATSDKKVCVIGASKTMIGRLYRSAISQYLVGWQEYIAPWYALLETYGYSGHSMGTGYSPNIYSNVVTAQLDLSAYDIFIIGSTHNGLTTTGVGSWGTAYEAPSETSTYMGALRNLIEYIYTQNPIAKIYVSTLEQEEVYYDHPDTYGVLEDDLNDKIRAMCKALSLELNDWAADAGFNIYTYNNPDVTPFDPTAGYTYDGTHFNQRGAQVIGLLTRKNVIGF